MKTLTQSLCLALGAVLLAGCSSQVEKAPQAKAQTQPDKKKPGGVGVVEQDPVAEERGKLAAEDRALVDAQEWCVVADDERLGSMGAPVKLTIKGQPVFLCCKGCQKKAEADPDKTIAKLEELKAKKKASGGKS